MQSRGTVEELSVVSVRDQTTAQSGQNVGRPECVNTETGGKTEWGDIPIQRYLRAETVPRLCVSVVRTRAESVCEAEWYPNKLVNCFALRVLPNRILKGHSIKSISIAE
jgi:hypothetical protein